MAVLASIELEREADAAGMALSSAWRGCKTGRRVAAGLAIVRPFACASLFWLVFQVRSGMIDPLTRVLYPIRATQIP